MSRPRDIALALLVKLTDAGEVANLGRKYRDSDLELSPATTILYSLETVGSAEKDHRESMLAVFIRQARVDDGDYMEIGDGSETVIKSLVPVGQWSDTHPSVKSIQPVRAAISLSRDNSNIVEARVEYRIIYADQYGA